MEITHESRPADVVRAFYEALIGADPEAVGALAGAAFADDMAVELPASLPYGGRFEGGARLAKMFRAMARGPAESGPREMVLENVVDGGDVVVARLSFGYRVPGSQDSVPSGAMEEWTFANGRVVLLRAYYADTAPLGGAQ